jgi:hypothetical protein
VARLERVSIGIRPRTARAVVVVLAANEESPIIAERLDAILCSSDHHEFFQPFHAVMHLPWEQAIPATRLAEKELAKVALRFLRDLRDELREKGRVFGSAGIVGAPDRDLAAIRSSHIRAHAAEGVLFRRIWQTALEEARVEYQTFSERSFESTAAARLRLPLPSVRAQIARFGRAVGAPWRADEKAAALVAWAVLAGAA